MATQLLYFFIFPGLLFLATTGALLSWFDRKITARIQFRVGPPLLQPFYDFFKLLLVKETILPRHGSPYLFFLAPVVAVAGATMAGVFILLPLMNIDTGFRGDLFVIFYLLTIPSLTYITGALASGNPLAALGGSREMKLIMSYELTFLLVIAGIILKSGQQTDLYGIIGMQKTGLPFIGNLSGIILFVVAICCLQAKLALVPFDMPEAEAEISGGIFIEFSGITYAFVKLSRYIMFFVLPAFLAALFMAGFSSAGAGPLWAALKILGVVLLLTLIRNTNPRIKIKQAIRFFMVWMNLLAILAIILTYFGL
jgi:NADH-quinone oxidoreductase subunit H